MNMTRTVLIIVFAVVQSLLLAAPLIGVNVDVHGDHFNGDIKLSSKYVDAVTSAGGIPILLPPVLEGDALKRYVELCDGFLMSGGRDISPARYGEDEVHTSAKILNPRREEFDFRLIKAVLGSGKPILAVCLGSQELNVALGGSLIQDLPSETSSTINHRPKPYLSDAHSVDITTGTLLEDIVGTTSLVVNSIHHQACNRLGSGVLVMARAPDGIVESFKVENADFALAVQWHPEALTTRSQQLAIYQALVKAAEAKAK